MTMKLTTIIITIIVIIIIIIGVVTTITNTTIIISHQFIIFLLALYRLNVTFGHLSLHIGLRYLEYKKSLNLFYTTLCII